MAKKGLTAREREAQLKAKVKAWFDKLEPARKRRVVVIGSASAALVFMVALSLLTPDKRQEKVEQAESKRRPPNLLQTPTQGMGLDSVSNDVASLRQELDTLRAEQAAREKADAEAKAREERNQPAPEPAASPDEALRSMRDSIVGSGAYQGAPPGTSLNPSRPGAAAAPTTSRPGPAANAAPPPPPVAPTMRVVRGKPSEIVQAPAPAQAARDVYIPTGSILTGVLLNGLDAPTGRNAQGQPVPVVVRLKHEAILPSRYRSDVREAFVLAAGFGDLSSERAYLRAERLSMILRDGRVIDIPIKMAAVGSDGKTGVRGTVVSKQGALIAKALLAGTAEGVSRAFGGNSSYGSFGRGNDLPSGQDLMTSGIGGGTSSALDRVASYFLQQAEAMYPVVEVAAGREVSFILLEGTDLSPRPPAEVEVPVAPGAVPEGATAAPN